jgi:hypothetical protein
MRLLLYRIHLFTISKSFKVPNIPTSGLISISLYYALIASSNLFRSAGFSHLSFQAIESSDTNTCFPPSSA